MHGRLIDVDALGIGYANPDMFPGRNRLYAEGWNQAIKILMKAPTVDAVPVVMCKDCRFLKFSDFYGECGCGCLGVVSPWDYCSHGEKVDVKTLEDWLTADTDEIIDCYSGKEGDNPCGQG